MLGKGLRIDSNTGEVYVFRQTGGGFPDLEAEAGL